MPPKSQNQGSTLQLGGSDRKKSESRGKVDQQYNDLQSNGNNNVDNILQWFKNSAVVGQALEAEARARQLFEDCVDKKDIKIDKFNQVLAKLAEDQQRNVEDLTNLLAEQGPRFLDLLEATDVALKEEMAKKRNF